jgi:hypothetical protein
MPAGRPSKYSDALAQEICDRISHGESLVKVLQTKGMPDYSNVTRWLARHEEFRIKYARARDEQAEFYANQIIDISDELPTCDMPDPDGGVTTRIDAAGVQRNKLRVDARKWVAAKLLPKKYGDSSTLALSGPNGGPIQSSITIEFVRPCEDSNP